MAKRRRPANAGDGPSDEWWREVSALFEESVRFYLRLSAVASKMHGDGPLSGPRRTVLLGLHRSGPRTVAQLAREREQSRQRFQPIVNALIADGLLQAVPNAAHKQSPLIVLTASGRRTVQRIQATEQAWLPRLRVSVSRARLSNATATLREVRGGLESLLRPDEQQQG
ncbi:MAG TPA: helix-turn-helix domain-containing protein [Vicinamibacterales bacterium]|nr:helix-turn-helix domain-containing protein [Vicinamibacterales bacterium]